MRAHRASRPRRSSRSSVAPARTRHVTSAQAGRREGSCQVRPPLARDPGRNNQAKKSKKDGHRITIGNIESASTKILQHMSRLNALHTVQATPERSSYVRTVQATPELFLISNGSSMALRQSCMSTGGSVGQPTRSAVCCGYVHGCDTGRLYDQKFVSVPLCSMTAWKRPATAAQPRCHRRCYSQDMQVLVTRVCWFVSGHSSQPVSRTCRHW